MSGKSKLSNLQQELLKLYENDISESDLQHIKTYLSSYLKDKPNKVESYKSYTNMEKDPLIMKESSATYGNTLINQLKQLSKDKQQQAEDYITSLFNSAKVKPAMEIISRQRAMNIGRLKGKIFISSDFNNTPGDFQDYL